MYRIFRISLLLCGLFTFVCTVAAQESKPNKTSPTVTASVTASGVRFVAPGTTVMQIRLEVFSASGEKLSDSKFRRGNIVDWRATDGQKALDQRDDSVLFVVTVRTLSGQLRQRHGLGAITAGRIALRSAARQDLSPLQAQASDLSRQTLAPVGLEPEAVEDFIILTDEMAGKQHQAATVTAHDGQTGQLTATTGALTFRTGDLFAGKDKEQMRITEDGKVGIGTDQPQATLDVAGTVRVSEGVKFADGTTLQAAGGKLSVLDANGDTTLAPATAGTGTQNRVAKWTETGGAGTLGDTQITENNGSVVVGNAGQTGNIQIYGGATQDVFAGMGPDINAGPAFNYGYAGGSFGRSAGFFNVRPDASAIAPNPSLRFMTTNVERMIVTNTGNIGIGTTNPATRLDVAGSFRTNSTAVIGSDLTVDTDTLKVDATVNRVGVGIAAPIAKLDVAGDINVQTNYRIGGQRILSTNGTNLFVGLETGQFNSTGSENTFVGQFAGEGNSSGSYNSFFGHEAGVVNGGQSGNSLFGARSGRNATGNYNSFFGGFTGTTTTGDRNTFIGYNAGSNNSSGYQNTFVGYSAGQFNSGGFNNTAIGREANAGGSYSTAVGSQASALGTNSTAIGNLTVVSGINSTAIGNLASATQDNSIVLGSINGVNNASADTSVGIGTSTPQARLHVANGAIRVEANAPGSGTTALIGERYRDNSIIAWGSANGDGTLPRSYGVSSMTRDAAGEYTITLSVTATTSAGNLVPIAIAEIEAVPTSAATARLVSINQVSTTQFKVYITNGSFAAVDNQFTFIVTGR